MIYRPSSVPSSSRCPTAVRNRSSPTAGTPLLLSSRTRAMGCGGSSIPAGWRTGRCGQLRINISSPTGHGGVGADRQTASWWAMADEPEQIVDRLRLALKFAFEEGARQERGRIANALLAE